MLPTNIQRVSRRFCLKARAGATPQHESGKGAGLRNSAPSDAKSCTLTCKVLILPYLEVLAAPMPQLGVPHQARLAPVASRAIEHVLPAVHPDVGAILQLGIPMQQNGRARAAIRQRPAVWSRGLAVPNSS